MALWLPVGMLLLIAAATSPMYFLRTRDTEYASTLLTGACVMALGAIAIWGFGAYSWLRFGDWEGYSAARAITDIGWGDTLLGGSGWAGIDRIADWYRHSSIAWTLIFAAFLTPIFADWWFDAGEAERLQRAK